MTSLFLHDMMIRTSARKAPQGKALWCPLNQACKHPAKAVSKYSKTHWASSIYGRHWLPEVCSQAGSCMTITKHWRLGVHRKPKSRWAGKPSCNRHSRDQLFLSPATVNFTKFCIAAFVASVSSLRLLLKLEVSVMQWQNHWEDTFFFFLKHAALSDFFEPFFGLFLGYLYASIEKRMYTSIQI